MQALTWHGTHDLRVENVPEPTILNPRDAIIRVRATTICGSDLHIYNGFIPTMRPGDIIGHEFMGEVVAVGSAISSLSIGDRVIVPSVIACGKCFYCSTDLYSLCDNSNPKAHLAETMWGSASAGIFGYSALMGGYAGSHAEYIRVPFADVGPVKVPEGITDDQALFISDAFPTGYMAADYGDIQPGDTVAVWGCGAVGLFAMRSAYLLGAERVIGIDRFPERLQMARDFGQAETLDYTKVDLVEALKQMTGGRGPDVCIDAVGMEAHASGLKGAYDRVKQAVRLETDRPPVLRQAIQACRKGGTVSIVGVYGGFLDKMPFGAAMNKSLKLRMGQMHAQRYLPTLVQHVQQGDIDPSRVVSHRMSLSEAPQAYKMFRDKDDNCMRIVLSP